MTPPPLSARQMVELFHLVFLRALYAGLADKTLIAINGGINLRFFFESVRFSEDLDLDVMTMAKETLENRVDRLLKSPAVVTPLKSRGISITDITKPKQTGTVQRWKIALTQQGREERTKLEFSRRDHVERGTSESVPKAIGDRFGIPPFVATHYGCSEAVRQKIHALAEREEPQPRDVFDLHLLFARPDAPTSLDAEAKGWLDRASKNAADISYDRYVALVIAYLEPEQAELFESEDTWAAMQLDVIGRIDALR